MPPWRQCLGRRSNKGADPGRGKLPGVKRLRLSILLTAFLLLTFWIRLREHNSFQVEFDQAMVQQFLWLMSHGFSPIGTLSEGHAFGDHFDPILYIFSIPFRWAGGFGVYLFLHLATLAVCGSAIYKIAEKRLGSEVQALVCTGAFLFSPLTLGAALYPLPHVALGLACFLWVIALDCEPRALAVGLLIAAMSVEMSLLPFAGLGLYLIWDGRRKTGVLLFGVTVLLMLFLTQVVTPSFGAEAAHDGLDRQMSRYSHYRAPLGVALERLGTHVSGYWSMDRVLLGQMLLGTGGLALLGLEAWILFLPGLAVNLLADFWGMHSVFLHYQATVVGGLYFAAILGMKRLSEDKRKYGVGALVVGTVLALWLGNPLSQRIGLPTERVLHYQSALSQIGPTDSVIAPPSAISHLALRKEIFSFPSLKQAASWADSPAKQAGVDWILVDLPGIGFPTQRNLLNLKLLEMLQDPAYGFHSVHGTLILLRRDGGKPIPEGLLKAIKPYAVEEKVDALTTAGLPSEALKLLGQQFGEKPPRADLLYLKGRALEELERFEEAREVYRAALELQPDPQLKSFLEGRLQTDLTRWTPRFQPKL